MEQRADGADPDFGLYDLASTNGTFVNGERVAAPRALRDGRARVLAGFALFDILGRDALDLPARSLERDAGGVLARAMKTAAAGQPYPKLERD